MTTFYVYIVQCGDGSLYAGWTKDVAARVLQHNAGTGAKYARSRLPVTLVYSREYSSQAEAMRVEREIKQLTREEKIRLVEIGT
jgi:putative endonuclease